MISAISTSMRCMCVALFGLTFSKWPNAPKQNSLIMQSLQEISLSWSRKKKKGTRDPKKILDDVLYSRDRQVNRLMQTGQCQACKAREFF